MLRHHDSFPGLFSELPPWLITQEHRELESWSDQRERMLCSAVLPVPPRARSIAELLLYHGWGTDVTRDSIGHLLGMKTPSNVSRGLTSLVAAGLLRRVEILEEGKVVVGYWKVFRGLPLCHVLAKYDYLPYSSLAREILEFHRRIAGNGPLPLE